MNEMLSAGIEIMLIGMGIVYAFLALLIVTVNAMSAIVQRYFPDVPTGTPTSQTQTSGQDAGTLAAIAAAVHQYRKKQQP